MLKGIPNILSPDLLKIMMEMGHGDELVIADGNFPAASNAKRLVRADGHNVPELLDAILKFYPLDYAAPPVGLMQVTPGHDVETPIWEEYRSIIKKYEEENFTDFELIERFEFYERAKKAYAIVATSEAALYANIILKKGIIKPDQSD